MPRQKSQHVDDARAVGRRLREARERAGLSQRQLAFPGCSAAYISRIEAGDRIPSLQLLRELGRRLRVSEDYLATGSEADPRAAALLEANLALRLDDVERAVQLYNELLAADDGASLRADALEGLGHVAFRRGDAREAIRLFEAALELTGQEESERPSLADNLGRAYASLGELAPALAIFERCLEAFRRRGDTLQAVRFAVLLGYALVDSGNFARAEQVIGRALADAKELDDPVARARLYWSQFKLRGEQGDFEEAHHYASLALATLEATEHSWFIARAHQGIAHIELDRGHAEDALTHLKAGWPLIEASGSPVDKAYFRIEEARALAQLGRYDEAAALAMEIGGQLGDALPEDAGRTYALLADVFTELGANERARELYELAAEFLEKNNPNRYLLDVYAKLAELCEADGRTEDAYAYMKRAVALQQVAAGNRLV